MLTLIRYILVRRPSNDMVGFSPAGGQIYMYNFDFEGHITR